MMVHVRKSMAYSVLILIAIMMVLMMARTLVLVMMMVRTLAFVMMADSFLMVMVRHKAVDQR